MVVRRWFYVCHCISHPERERDPHLRTPLSTHPLSPIPLTPPPPRPGKKSNFEGGVRVNAFASGGLIPAARRGTIETGWTASEDFYKTFAGLAGADPTDHRAAAAGLPPVEGYDLWPLISGAVTKSPRTEVWLGSAGIGDHDGGSPAIIQGVIREDGYKVRGVVCVG